MNSEGYCKYYTGFQVKALFKTEALLFSKNVLKLYSPIRNQIVKYSSPCILVHTMHVPIQTKLHSVMFSKDIPFKMNCGEKYYYINTVLDLTDKTSK